MAIAKQVRVTPFRARVYEATRRIPMGKVSTYLLVSKAIGCSCPRAVAQALRHNPFAPEVPCHRVISTAGALTGFGGSRDADALGRKRAMLKEEGVVFDDWGIIVDRNLIVSLPSDS